MKTMSSLLATAAIAIAFQAGAAAADTLSDIKDRGVLSVGVKNDYDPYGYLDADGNIVGFEIELARYIAKELLGSEGAVEIVPVTAANRIEFLQSGRIDLILTTLGVTEERKQVIDFTEAYVNAPGPSVLAHKDATFTEWKQLRGQQVCGIQGAYYNKHLTEHYGMGLVNFTSVPETGRALSDNRCVAMAYDDMTMRRMAASPDWADYKVAVEPYEFLPMAGGLRKGDEEFKAAVNAAIIKAEGEDKIIEWEKQFDMPPPNTACSVPKRRARQVTERSGAAFVLGT